MWELSEAELRRALAGRGWTPPTSGCDHVPFLPALPGRHCVCGKVAFSMSEMRCCQSADEFVGMVLIRMADVNKPKPLLVLPVATVVSRPTPVRARTPQKPEEPVLEAGKTRRITLDD